MSNDWKAIYGHPVYLAETFVDTSRFQGTCYQASNWIRAGKTQGSAKRGNLYLYHGPVCRQAGNLRNSTSILSAETSGDFLLMTRDEAIAILEMDREDAIQAILILAGKAEKYDRLCDKPSPTTPSGMIPPYLKPTSLSADRQAKRENGLVAGKRDIRGFPGNDRKK